MPIESHGSFDGASSYKNLAVDPRDGQLHFENMALELCGATEDSGFLQGWGVTSFILLSFLTLALLMLQWQGAQAKRPTEMDHAFYLVAS